VPPERATGVEGETVGGIESAAVRGVAARAAIGAARGVGTAAPEVGAWDVGDKRMARCPRYDPRGKEGIPHTGGQGVQGDEKRSATMLKVVGTKWWENAQQRGR